MVNITAFVELRPWYRVDVPRFIRVYRERRWWHGRVRAAIIAYIVARSVVHV